MEMQEKIPELTLNPVLEEEPVFEAKTEGTLVDPTPEPDNRPEAGPDLSQLSEAEDTRNPISAILNKLQESTSGLLKKGADILNHFVQETLRDLRLQQKYIR